MDVRRHATHSPWLCVERGLGSARSSLPAHRIARLSSLAPLVARLVRSSAAFRRLPSRRRRFPTPRVSWPRPASAFVSAQSRCRPFCATRQAGEGALFGLQVGLESTEGPSVAPKGASAGNQESVPAPRIRCSFAANALLACPANSPPRRVDFRRHQAAMSCSRGGFAAHASRLAVRATRFSVHKVSIGDRDVSSRHLQAAAWDTRVLRLAPQARS